MLRGPVIVQETLACCNEPAKRKRLGRSGTFMAQWFRRWDSGASDPGFDPRTVRYTFSHHQAPLT